MVQNLSRMLEMAWCMGSRLSSCSPPPPPPPPPPSWRLITSLPLQSRPSLHIPLPPLPLVVRKPPGITSIFSSRDVSTAAAAASSSSPVYSSSGNLETREDEPNGYHDDDDDEDEDDEDDDGERDRRERRSSEDQGSLNGRNRRRFPPLTPREKKELRAYAHSLGKKIVSQQIGKAGVTPALATAMGDILEANEILKLKVLDNCPDELNEVIRKIEEATDGQVVGKIGSVLTLYRPSLRKLSSAQKKKTSESIQFRRR